QHHPSLLDELLRQIECASVQSHCHGCDLLANAVVEKRTSRFRRVSSTAYSPRSRRPGETTTVVPKTPRPGRSPATTATFGLQVPMSSVTVSLPTCCPSTRSSSPTRAG